MKRLIEEGRVLWPSNSDGRPRRKAFVDELLSERTGYSSIIGKDIYTRNGTADIEEVFGKRIMDFPKPVLLIKELVRQANLDKDDIVMDFFLGSATTAHAVMSLNLEDNGGRRLVMIQLPEMCDEKSEAFKAGYQTIAGISRERIRRAGKKIKEENLENKNMTSLDVGFRVLKVDSSNMNDVYYTPDTLIKEDLFNQSDNNREDRSSEDLLFQVLLDWGVDLTLSIKEETIAGKNVFFVDKDALAACFETGINEDFVKKLATHKPMRVVFRDAGFENDSVKINVEQIFKLISPSTEVKVI